MVENTQTENSYYKGENFEKLFGEFMKSDLGWDKYRLRAQQKGKANSKGSQVDIIGFKKDDRGRRLSNLSLLFSIMAVGLVAITFVLEYGGFSDIADLTIGLSIPSLLGGLYCYWTYKNYQQENAWVECKNRKGKATYEQVQKCINEYRDYKATGDKEYKFVELYFVSASGFVENAIKLAMDNGFICYEYNKNGKFEIAEYWQ